MFRSDFVNEDATTTQYLKMKTHSYGCLPVGLAISIGQHIILLNITPKC